MKQRVILHSDANCFYASCEMVLNPELRDKAVAVGGNEEERHGIILAKSEKAKKAGIMDKPLKVALMGCVVNGPGEAKEADIGIAGGLGDGIVFRRGEVLGRVPEGALVDTLIEYIRNM